MNIINYLELSVYHFIYSHPYWTIIGAVYFALNFGSFLFLISRGGFDCHYCWNDWECWKENGKKLLFLGFGSLIYGLYFFLVLPEFLSWWWHDGPTEEEIETTEDRGG